ncbi:HNH endonuclease [Escherichia coli]
MARYFTREIDRKWFAKIDEENTFIREYKHKDWRYWGKTSHFIVAVRKGYWKEITAVEAGDLQYADCSQCAENWPELFDYHHDGYLISKVARGNKVKPGDIIRGSKVTSQKNYKYFQIRINCFNYRLHRIVWEMFNGPVPDGYVVINDDDSCVKIENLKLISHSEKEVKRKALGKSGIKGVCWNKKDNKWHASIKANAICHHLGFFDNINDAINARINGEIRYYGKQMNNFPDYISPEEAERIRQCYYEGEEMKQIEISTEPPEQDLPLVFKFHGHDVRVNEADEINLMDIAAAYGVNDDELRHRIESLNKLPGYIYCTEHCDMQIKKGYAPFEIAGMIVARIGSEKDRVDLSLAFRKFKDNRIREAFAQQTDGKQVKDLKYQVKTLEGQIKELHGVLNIAREDRDSYQHRVDYWKRQYNQSNKAFGDEQGKRQKLESERDNLVKTNCELRQKLNAANNDDAKAKATADKQTINDLRADLEEAKETINAQQQEACNKALAIKGYQLKVVELEDDKRELQNDLNILQTGHNILLDRYNKLTARNMRRRAAQKRYMGDLHNNHVTDALEWMQAIKGAGDYYKQRQQRNQERYRKLIIALQDKVKELLYRLDKKPEGGFFSKVKSLFHH